MRLLSQVIGHGLDSARTVVSDLDTLAGRMSQAG